MITLHFPAIKKKIYQYGVPFVMGKPPQQQQQNTVLPDKPDTRTLNLMDKWSISYEEFKRRNDVIRELYRMCPYIAGDRVVPKDAEKRKRYGTMSIVGICKDLFEFEHDTSNWPPNDNPMVVTCRSDKEGEIMCTTNFFIRANSGGQC